MLSYFGLSPFFQSSQIIPLHFKQMIIPYHNTIDRKKNLTRDRRCLTKRLYWLMITWKERDLVTRQEGRRNTSVSSQIYTMSIDIILSIQEIL